MKKISIRKLIGYAYKLRLGEGSSIIMGVRAKSDGKIAQNGIG